MKKKEKVVNISFFKKVWYSITQFEQYPTMAVEGFKRAMKYLIMLTAIATVFATIGALLQMKTLIGDLAKYVQDNIPEFSYFNGKVSMENQEPIVIDNVEYTEIDKIIINTLAETDEQKEQVEKDNSTAGTTVFFYNDEIVLKAQIEEETVKQEYTYSDFVVNYTGKYIEKFNKTEFVQYLTSKEMSNFYIRYGLIMFLYLLIIEIIITLVNALEIALLGLITATIARIKMKFSIIYNMAIYSLTLPTILNILYMIINYFTSFTISYFQVAYITIAYIYIATVIFILKDDIIRKMQEVEKIKQEQIKVREEIREEEQEKKDKEDKKEDDDKKEDNENDEPQGSEA